VRSRQPLSPRRSTRTASPDALDWTINSKHTAYLSVATQANNSLNDQSGGSFDLTEGNFTKNHLQVANLTLNSASRSS